MTLLNNRKYKIKIEKNKGKLIQVNDTKKYRHNLIPKELYENLLMGTTSIQYDHMGYPLRLFVDQKFKGHWIDIPVSDIREEDVVVKLERVV